MTPYERLLLDELPSCPETPAPGRARDWRGTWTPAEQAQHRNDLLAALTDWTDTTDPRHLRLVRNEAA
ncbi:hypothetical protein ABT160_02530 [Streptomyces sp. NPDC001941]|uniref:hypothetical protein n=1 Tax=Streptomyces sp. NPDC001941 TaxID=3154659 RepID=UPI003327F4B9